MKINLKSWKLILGTPLAIYLLFGEILDSLGNLLEWITPTTTYIGTVIIVFIIGVIYLFIGNGYVYWGNLKIIRSSHLNGVLVGCLISLWLPRIFYSVVSPSMTEEASFEQLSELLKENKVIRQRRNLHRKLLKENESIPDSSSYYWNLVHESRQKIFNYRGFLHKNFDKGLRGKIVKLYESGRKEEAYLLLPMAFNFYNHEKLRNNEDEKLGLIVASYFATGEFDQAAIHVLERDKSRRSWDHSLKLDLAKCLRNYCLTHSFIEGIDFVDSLFEAYNSEIISPYWLTIPYKVVYNIEMGYHSSSDISYEIGEEETRNIQYLLKEKPFDTYCSYGYYVLGDYNSAINCNKESRILDLIYLATGEDLLYDLYARLDLEFDANFGQPIKDKTLIALANQSAYYFKEYLAKFPKADSADDCLYYLALIYANLGDYTKAIVTLDQIDYFGDGYSTTDKYELKEKLFKYVPKEALYENLREDLAKATKVKKIEYDKQLYLISALKSLTVEERINLISEAVDTSSAYLLLRHIKSLLDEGNLEEGLAVYDLANLKMGRRFKALIAGKNDAQELADLFDALKVCENLNISNYPKKYLTAILTLKNKLRKRGLALHYIDRVLEDVPKFRNKGFAIDYLFYLKLRILVVDSPAEAEELIAYFLSAYPDSEFSDDFLAEQIYINLYEDYELPRAEENLTLLLDNYPEGNAVDNALNWISTYLEDICTSQGWHAESRRKTSCKRAISINQILLEQYPESKFYASVERRQKVCQKELGLIETAD